ncbi:RnfABCDGE type electron transport complex subunit B [Stagnimonas aquatica]|uniref:RnfABCDGE type electron transport complex subunit B n=1 Tax=Stagnimonas aquatica TaxID=2689987 RepID=A0A3N0VET4_9GAMM|nr:RnfABCDGE type electron transport complex subunit B [Stagnimonas aquatica]ROH91192.1 RnfABCDGE type electron transport complex subunit B [Stagnimonas aquatica]
MTSLADRLDAALPQTQCTRCGYPDCRAYAEALANGVADIDQCPPGGQAGVARLAALLGVAEKPLNPSYGVEIAVELVARVIEADCIGCTKCIQACPVDAISGGANLMHTVISAECTGCELCIPPCPVDCIEMVEAPGLPAPYVRAPHSLLRYGARQQRLRRWQAEDAAARARKKAADPLAAALAKARGAPP